mgnify:CR=1 FL=1
MANVFDYLAWRGDLPFSVIPFNAVDSLILSRLLYLPFDGVVPAAFTGAIRLTEAAAVMQSEELSYRLAKDKRLLEALAASPPVSKRVVVRVRQSVEPRGGEAVFSCLHPPGGRVALCGVSRNGWNTGRLEGGFQYGLQQCCSIPTGSRILSQ